MEPLVTFEVKEHYLLIVGHGKRDNLASMVEAAAKIYQMAIEANRRLLLVDYRQLEINVRMGEAFNIVKQYESAQPELKNSVIAAVFDSKGMAFGNYWKEVGQRRGFFIEIFDDMDVAERWLLAQKI